MRKKKLSKKPMLLMKRETKFGKKPSKAEWKAAISPSMAHTGKICVVFCGNYVYGPFKDARQAQKFANKELALISGWAIRPLTDPKVA